jgi:hypothetical protein
MKIGRLIVLVLIGMVLAFGLSGCKIISASPNPSRTITLTPGQTQKFSVYQIGGPSQDIWWSIDGKALPWGLSDPFYYNFTAKPEDIGEHAIRCDIEDYIYIKGNDINGGGGGTYITLWTGFQEWTVEIPGVTFDPLDLITVTPGENIEYTARVWPEGQYAFQWYLDGVLVGAERAYTFSPAFQDIGHHTLAVTASGMGKTFTYTRDITVPFASVGGSGTEFASSVQQTSDDGYIVAGSSWSTDIPGVDNHGCSDFYLVKLNTQGSIQWQRMFGGGANDEYPLVRQTNDGGYVVTGEWLSDAGGLPIIKLDSFGNKQWERLLNEYNFAFTQQSLQATSDGGCIIAGLTYISLQGYPNDLDYSGNAFVMKITPQGDTQWCRIVGGSSLDCLSGIIETVDGGYIAAGTSSSDNIAGLTNHGKNDAYFVKFDSSGDVVWQKMFGGVDDEYMSCIQQTYDGGFIAAGSSEKIIPSILTNWNTDYLVIRLDPLGNMLWQKKYGDTVYDTASMVFQLADGTYRVFGNTLSYHLDSEGNVLSSKGLPDASVITATSDGGQMVAVDYNNDIKLIKLDGQYD